MKEYAVVPLVHGNQYADMCVLECQSLGELLEIGPEAQWEDLRDGRPVVLTVNDPTTTRINEFAARGVNFQVFDILCKSTSPDTLYLETNCSDCLKRSSVYFNVIKPFRCMALSSKRRRHLRKAVSDALGLVNCNSSEPSIREKLQLDIILLSTSQRVDFDLICVAQLLHTSSSREKTCMLEQPQLRAFQRRKNTNNQNAQSLSEDGSVFNHFSTPLPPDLSLILCNMAKLQEGSTVYDPFCGQASILKVARDITGPSGCFGSDIKILAENSIENIEIFNADISQSPLLQQAGSFSAIICDPPFGLRETVRGAASREDCSTPNRSGISILQGLVPQMFLLSSKLLGRNGRLVFLYPDFPNSTSFMEGGMSWSGEKLLEGISSLCSDNDELKDIAKCFKLVGIADQTWKKSTGHIMIRRVSVFEKVGIEERD